MSHVVDRFEDLIAWQKARAVTKEIYHVTDRPSLPTDYRYLDQLRSSAVSVMANIAEGFERGSAAEFHRFLSISKASCAELRSHLYVGVDTGRITSEDFERLLCLAEEVARIIGALRVSVGRRRQ
jgi:four helix bundle protein